MSTPDYKWEQRNMTPEEMTLLNEFVRSELAGIIARWRERAAMLERSHSDPDESLIWEIAQEAETLRKCAGDIGAAIVENRTPTPLSNDNTKND